MHLIADFVRFTKLDIENSKGIYLSKEIIQINRKLKKLQTLRLFLLKSTNSIKKIEEYFFISLPRNF